MRWPHDHPVVVVVVHAADEVGVIVLDACAAVVVVKHGMV